MENIIEKKEVNDVVTEILDVYTCFRDSMVLFRQLDVNTLQEKMINYDAMDTHAH